MLTNPSIRRSVADLARFRAALADEYRARFPRSHALCEPRGRVLLDQTSHAVRWNEPFHVTVARAEGSTIVDVDGHRILDYWQGHYANLLGHNPPRIRAALAAALAEGRGLQSGMAHAVEAEVAELICRMTGVDVVRFTTSGALATFYAVLLARAFTGRRRVLKVAGGWHGSQPFGLKGVHAHDGRFDRLDSEGLPGSTQEDVELVRYNDVEALRRCFVDQGDAIACFIVEPWLGSGGGIAAAPEFLREARRLTAKHGALLLCDEIITGFRFRAGDVSALYGVKPDLLILGKVVGGGMPVATVGGRRDVMELCSRSVGRVKFEGGTYSAHELSLVAAKAMLEHLEREELTIYPRLAELGAKLRASLTGLFAEAGVPIHMSGLPNSAVAGSSIVMLHLANVQGPPPTAAEDLVGPERAHPVVQDDLLRSVLLLEGVSVRHGLGAISLAHTEEELARTVDAFRAALARLRGAGLL